MEGNRARKQSTQLSALSETFFSIICLRSARAGFMLSLFRFTIEECGLPLGVEFNELERLGLRTSGTRRICFNVAVIFKYSVEMTSTGTSACTIYNSIKYLFLCLAIIHRNIIHNAFHNYHCITTKINTSYAIFS